MSTNVRKLAQQLAQHGRYGDSLLVHLNPAELSFLERVGGAKATINPVTGLKEAFLPFLIPIIASIVGSVGGAVANKFLTPKNNDKAPDDSAARKYIEAQAAKAKEGYKVPTLNYYQPQPQQGGTPAGLGPEQFIAPIRSFAEGGMLPEQQDAAEVYHEAMEALTGQSETPEESIQRFIEVFGEDALKKLMAQVQQGGGAQQQAARGGMLKGPGGGMDDLMMAKVGGSQPVALSGGEYVVPADATSMLGDGNSDAGARRLDAMVARVRMQKTGTAKQAGKINPRVMPA